MFDTVHLVKNIRNNLIATKFFQIPALEISLMDVNIKANKGIIRWSIFHRIHKKIQQSNAI